MDGEARTDEELLSLAEELIEKGDSQGAKEALDAVKRNSGKKYFIESKYFRQKGWFNEERKCLKKALKEEPENEEYGKAMQALEEFRKSDEYKNARKQMGLTNALAEVCFEGGCECCGYCICTGICEGLSGGC